MDLLISSASTQKHGRLKHLCSSCLHDICELFFSFFFFYNCIMEKKRVYIQVDFWEHLVPVRFLHRNKACICVIHTIWREQPGLLITFSKAARKKKQSLLFFWILVNLCQEKCFGKTTGTVFRNYGMAEELWPVFLLS